VRWRWQQWRQWEEQGAPLEEGYGGYARSHRTHAAAHERSGVRMCVYIVMFLVSLSSDQLILI